MSVILQKEHSKTYLDVKYVKLSDTYELKGDDDKINIDGNVVQIVQ